MKEIDVVDLLKILIEEKNGILVNSVNDCLAIIKNNVEQNGQNDRASALRQLIIIAQQYKYKRLTLAIHDEIDNESLKNSGVNAFCIKNSNWSAQLDDSGWGNERSNKFLPNQIITEKRKHNEISSDCVLNRTGIKSYLSNAQKDAIRAILTAPPRAVLLVIIPTGGGKSLCLQLPAHYWNKTAEIKGTTVVIVPTIALALDQEIAIKAFFKDEGEAVALTGDTQPIKRKLILEKIRKGEIPVVFMAPEMALGSEGSHALKTAAENKKLNSLVIDEAHLITSWGRKFRPSFQRLAKFRSELSDIHSGMSTVLLSATISTESKKTLTEFYVGKKDYFKEINGASLRNEHEFAVLEAIDEKDRDNLTENLIGRCLRPFIIYTTKIMHATELSERFKNKGFSRHRCFTGETLPEERKNIIQEWRKGEIDFVVATSAFGMGIDKANVRTVIHPTLPESLDRFYQEVGRTGRDGLSALSIVIRNPRDLETAKRMSLILESITAAKRWNSMWRNQKRNSRHDLINDKRFTFVIDLDDRAYHVQAQNDYSGITNWEWNAATALLMERAKLIEIETDDNSGDKSWTISATEETCHLFGDDNCLASQIEPTRKIEYEFNIKMLDQLNKVLTNKNNTCIMTAFAATYDLVDPKCCGVCPVCRTQQNYRHLLEQKYQGVSNWGLKPAKMSDLTIAIKQKLGGHENENQWLIQVSENEKVESELIKGILKELANEGFHQFIIPRSIRNQVVEYISETKSIGIIEEIESFQKITTSKIHEISTVLLLIEIKKNNTNEMLEGLKQLRLYLEDDSQIKPKIVVIIQRGLLNPNKKEQTFQETLNGRQCDQKVFEF